jgi:hypothetical protein
MIRAKSEGKKEKHAEFKRVWNEACLAGDEAVRAHYCTPMVVEQHANVMDDSSPVIDRWVVADGACGFAWVKVPGNTAFARWAKENAGFKPGYHGTTFWVSSFGQSYEKKNIWASKVAEILREQLDVKAYADGRLD